MAFDQGGRDSLALRKEGKLSGRSSTNLETFAGPKEFEPPVAVGDSYQRCHERHKQWPIYTKQGLIDTSSSTLKTQGNADIHQPCCCVAPS